MTPDGREHPDESDERYTVLEVFGIKLQVSNPRVAEILTMDAKEVLAGAPRDLGSPQAEQELRAEAAQAAPTSSSGSRTSRTTATPRIAGSSAGGLRVSVASSVSMPAPTGCGARRAMRPS